MLATGPFSLLAKATRCARSAYFVLFSMLTCRAPLQNPVQQHPLSTLTDLTTEKSKHLHLTFPSVELHFTIGSKDAFDEIVAKIEAGRSPAAASTPAPPPAAPRAPPAPQPAAAAYIPPPPPLRGASATSSLPPPPIRSAAVTPPPAAAPVTNGSSNEGNAVALYDFDPQGADELALVEGDRVEVVIGASDDPDWLKIRKGGEEGVVPASYVEV